MFYNVWVWLQLVAILFDNAKVSLRCDLSDNVFIYDESGRQVYDLCQATGRFYKIFSTLSTRRLTIEYKHSSRDSLSVGFEWFVFESSDQPSTTKIIPTITTTRPAPTTVRPTSAGTTQPVSATTGASVLPSSTY